ncbi:hypothetical protein BXY47_2554 [Dietzia kunjamensis]|uniref:hypothetical protein n=1 Tax=Dietzia kunjamensis TaxID=322509 RepID=UPI000FF5E63B|nr:hypothetical protein [Dietzia kunjamensis]RKE59470.1 hypothetical protein BXY47_2554 [Dietzia kunjamensis]
MQQSESGRQAPGDRATFCEAPAAYIVETYFVLRMVIAGAAIGLPVALLVWVTLDPDFPMMDSLSSFYYTPARGLFVGTLVAIGVALVAYRGYTRGENWLLNAAGTLAIVVALFPTEDPVMPGLNAVSITHAVAATSFFVLAALSIFFYGQETIPSIPNAELQRSYRLGYRILVVLVLLFPALALLIAWLMDSTLWLFLVETAALYAFATFWIVKTYELSRSHSRRMLV